MPTMIRESRVYRCAMAETNHHDIRSMSAITRPTHPKSKLFT